MLGLRSVEKKLKKKRVLYPITCIITLPLEVPPALCVWDGRGGRWGRWVGGKELQSVEELLQAGLHMRLSLAERS